MNEYSNKMAKIFVIYEIQIPFCILIVLLWHFIHIHHTQRGPVNTAAMACPFKHNNNKQKMEGRGERKSNFSDVV